MAQDGEQVPEASQLRGGAAVTAIHVHLHRRPARDAELNFRNIGYAYAKTSKTEEELRRYLRSVKARQEDIESAVVVFKENSGALARDDNPAMEKRKADLAHLRAREKEARDNGDKKMAAMFKQKADNMEASMPRDKARDCGGPFPTVAIAVRDAVAAGVVGAVKLSRTAGGNVMWKLSRDAAGAELIGQLVRFNLPYAGGSYNGEPTKNTKRMGGTVKQVLPDGRLEVKGQDGGYYKVRVDELIA